MGSRNARCGRANFATNGTTRDVQFRTLQSQLLLTDFSRSRERRPQLEPISRDINDPLFVLANTNKRNFFLMVQRARV